MHLFIDADSASPPYEQLRSQITEQVRSGAVPPGTRLPTVRRLAEELGLAANTVARAYRELEHGGVVETRGRNGTFVRAADAVQASEARAAALAFARRAHELGLDDETALGWVRAALAEPA
ncbi:GntR family transcriptional regulator [Cellulomonas timonensis]|uniref:GntR family transcriptional regulator n=1 Tax=Cellulomonas timonensis TaxID=1689271 RepID=UPI000831D474|nr:GntR family transcriptional regulator [Cellulomonas timonensis]